MTDENCPLTEREMYAAEVVGEHYRRQMRKVVVAVAIACAISIGGCVVGWVLVKREAEDRVNDIQQSRLELLTASCEASNKRNHDTKLALVMLMPKHPSDKERAELAATKLLIDALSPYTTDCRLAAIVKLKG